MRNESNIEQVQPELSRPNEGFFLFDKTEAQMFNLKYLVSKNSSDFFIVKILQI